MKRLTALLLIMVFLSGCGKIELNNAVPLALGLDFQNDELL